MLLNLIAIDPGGETGLAWATYNPVPNEAPAHKHIMDAFANRMGGVEQITGGLNEQTLEICTAIAGVMKRSGQAVQKAYEVRTIVVIEDFTYHPSGVYTQNVLSPVKLGARIEFYLWLENFEVTLEWAQPGEQSVIRDKNLQRWGLWSGGKHWDDAMTALKHLIVRARKYERELRVH